MERRDDSRGYKRNMWLSQKSSGFRTPRVVSENVRHLKKKKMTLTEENSEKQEFKSKSVEPKVVKKGTQKKGKEKTKIRDNFVAPDGGWGWIIVLAAGFSNVSKKRINFFFFFNFQTFILEFFIFLVKNYFINKNSIYFSFEEILIYF